MDRGTALIVAVVVVAYAWWTTQLPPFATRTTVAVVSGGIAAMVLGSRWKRPGPAPRPPGTTVAVWMALLGALAAWQLAAYFQHPRSAHPTLSSLANALMDSHPARTLGFTIWLAGAACLARR